MADFETAYAPLKQFEGGWSNDPADAGGETYAGIARRYFPEWEGWKIVDQYKKAVRNTPKAMTAALGAIPTLQKLVAGWYEKEWWDRLGLARLPQKLADEIFEQAVNLGKAGCGKKVQTICNAYNYGPGGSRYFTDLKIDGAIGPKTLNALAVLIAKKTDAASLVHALNCMQGAHYLELAAKKPSQRKYTAGWMKRTHCED